MPVTWSSRRWRHWWRHSDVRRRRIQRLHTSRVPHNTVLDRNFQSLSAATSTTFSGEIISILLPVDDRCVRCHNNNDLLIYLWLIFCIYLDIYIFRSPLISNQPWPLFTVVCNDFCLFYRNRPSRMKDVTEIFSWLFTGMRCIYIYLSTQIQIQIQVYCTCSQKAKNQKAIRYFRRAWWMKDS